MSKTPIPLVTADISKFARSLSQQLTGTDAPPSHLTLLNMLARAAGFRNFQHLNAAKAAQARLHPTPAETCDFRRVERALAQFDATGRLRQWPARRAIQDLCLWVLWANVPAHATLHERDVNGVLNHGHSFDDPAQLRRGLLSMGLLTRNRDGSDYRRIEQRPPPEARALIRHIAERRTEARKAL
ncbi:DUF2087 domain-containing protein [Pseudosulfitobacter sp. DSM 107133]|uniref:DUF2087 domain-containing protein n=1 Tax=Pseudosulfitobacter sp. DSM 107133 TaxID=2883100 RepID=UPI000DF2CAC6|nr:DUF2087 domain-containing protein [Pseudosulfitobacter sp. DSM 107133]UOA25965.1 hypothetical protein DSM107133_00655 [Pseudosulfitobacter sp. DSM 107133]